MLGTEVVLEDFACQVKGVLVILFSLDSLLGGIHCVWTLARMHLHVSDVCLHMDLTTRTHPRMHLSCTHACVRVCVHLCVRVHA